MLIFGLLTLALGAGNTASVGEVTLRLQPLSGDGKAVLLQQEHRAPALHRLHVHTGPDGRTQISCELSHRRVPDLRRRLREGEALP